MKRPSFLLLVLLPFVWQSLTAAQTPETRSPLIFRGGHETMEGDHGRPVILIAAALSISPEIFRQAFSHVKPAPAGQQPEPDQVHKNKDVLLQALSPYGVTNEKLDEVSDYYRYRRENGDLWRHTEAEGYALKSSTGEIIRFVLTNPGAGYSSPPQITVVARPDVHLTSVLVLSTVLTKNGALAIRP